MEVNKTFIGEIKSLKIETILWMAVPKWEVCRLMNKEDKPKRPTLVSVAKHAGLDPSTVSRVLNGDPTQRASGQTRDRIIESAKTLGYRPNILARNLRLSRSKSICIVLPQLDNPALSNMMEGAFAACEERDYFPYLVVTPKTSTTSEILKKLEKLEHVDGVLAASFDDSAAIGLAVETLPIHTVIMNKKIAGKVNCVWIDSLNAAETVCYHLLAEGHRKIGFIGGLSGGFNAEQRLEGYLSALRSFDVEIDFDLIKEVGYTFSSGYEASKVLLKNIPDLTAIFCTTLASAEGAWHGVRKYGTADQTKTVIGALHGGVMAECLGLTVVEMPTYDLGYQGATGLIDLIEGRTISIRKSLSPLELRVFRDLQDLT